MLQDESVILVDENDQQIGIEEKMEAHRSGQLHRAISVFILNSENKMLLQQRAYTKYHSGGLWTNACCSHPRPGENTGDAAKRRLREEMGLETKLEFLFHFTYKARLDNELTEHELDHVFIGRTDAVPVPDPNEVCSFDYFSFKEIEEKLLRQPDQFTYWFKMILDRVKSEAKKRAFI